MKRDAVKFLRKQPLDVNISASLEQPRSSMRGKLCQQVHIGRSAAKIVVHRKYVHPAWLLARLSNFENQIPTHAAPREKPFAKRTLQTFFNGPGTNLRLV